MPKSNTAKKQAKEKFKGALIELCEEKGLSNVTVSALTKKCGYNRCTFYNYYDDIRSLLTDIETELLLAIENDLNDMVKNSSDKRVVELLSGFFSAAGFNKSLFILIGERGDVSFREKLLKTMRPYGDLFIKGRISPELEEYIGAFIISASLGTFEQWYNSSKSVSAEELKNLVNSLVLKGLIGTFNLR